MEPLNKLILNNKIVEMRQAVRQSRIQSINKLVKEIKKLREKKGTEEQKVKNANKADRFVECIRLMKKIKEDDVSKFALMNEKSLAQITNNVDESPEIKAVARIADHHPIYAKVKSFREKYPNWKEVLPLLFDSLGDRYQDKKKKKKVPRKKTNTSENKNKPEKENKSSTITYIHNSVGTWKVEEVRQPKEKPCWEQSKQKCDREKESSPSNESFNDQENLEEKNDHTKNENLNKSVSKSLKTDKIKLVTEETENIKKEKIKKPSKENDNPINEEKITRTVDPFFVTKDNKEYLSVNVITREDDKEKKNVEEKKSKFSFNHKSKNVSEPKSREKSFKSSKLNARKEYPRVENKEVTLHPSWEAKRKQASISQFKGKKIKFDD